MYIYETGNLTIPAAHAYEGNGFDTPLAAQTGMGWGTRIRRSPWEQPSLSGHLYDCGQCCHSGKQTSWKQERPRVITGYRKDDPYLTKEVWIPNIF